MTVKEYLQKLGISKHSSIELTFMVAIPVKEGSWTHEVYCGTPIRPIWEWFGTDKYDQTNAEASILNSLVLNIKQPQISWMSGVDWNPQINNNHLMSLLVITREDLLKHYCESQADSMISYIDKKIEKTISNGTNPWLGKK